MGFRCGWLGVVLGLVFVGGCGGTTRNANESASTAGTEAGGTSAGTASAGSGGRASGGGAAGDAGGPAEPPATIDGVPIGDCRETTSEVRAAAGCPEQPPEDGTACEAVGEVKTCPYSINVEGEQATQRVHVCHHEQLIWGSYDVPCGTVCTDLGPHVIDVPQEQACAARSVTTCRNSDLFAFETQQQWLDSALARVISSCANGPQFGTRYLLELDQGCPTRLSSAVALPSDVAACITSKLGGLRWDCAVNLSCGRFLVPIPLGAP